MTFVLTVSIAICLFIILSILFVPEIRIGKLTLSTYWLIALIGSSLMLIFGYLPCTSLINGLFDDSAVNPIKILILFISMTGLSVFLDETGFFRLAAQAVLRHAKSSPKRLFVYLYCTVAFLTVFTSNDIIVLTLTPFICYFAKNARISPVPYLVAEFVAANTWSMALIIGNPTNIYLATSFNINFFEYAKTMLLPTIFAGSVSFAVLYLIFRKQLSTAITANDEIIESKNKAQLIIGLVHLSICTILLSVSSYIKIEMWLVALAFFFSLIICNCIYEFISKTHTRAVFRTAKRLPWQLVPFVLSMFTVVLALSEYGITEKICAFLGKTHIAFRYGLTSFLSANIINNIPMSVLFVKILECLPHALRADGIYAAIIGSNIGAFFTPLGALAGIMWTSILKNLNVKFSFCDFIKYGATVSIPTLLAAILGLLIL